MVESVSIDFETRSTVDLRRAGVYVYAAHPDTDIWCMAWAVGDNEPAIWVPGQPFPELLRAQIQAGTPLCAWNAQFERLIWAHIMMVRYEAPLVPPSQWFCTAAQAAAMALPRSLDECARVMRVEQQKDQNGYALMLRMSRPRSTEPDGTPVWWDVPDRRRRLEEYCLQDVRTERVLARSLKPLSERERQVYLLDQRVNDRGVKLDVPLAHGAREIAQEGVARANAVIANLTNGDVTAVTQHGRLLQWVQQQGVETDTVKKSAVTEMLESDLSPVVRDVLAARAEAGKSSVAKIASMLEVAGSGDRMRGLLLYYGANTGRWAGRLVQPQNFPRGDVPDVERFIPDVLAGRYDDIELQQSPVSVVSSLLRSMLIAEKGRVLVGGDFSAIEARVLNWLAGQEDVVQRFRAGEPVYEQNAARIYKLPVEQVTRVQRQTGKFQELGCGFGMGAVKAVTAARDVYGVTITADEAKSIVDDYRARHASVVDYWYNVERAARHAVEHPGATFTAGPFDRQVKLSVRGKYLWLVLPSGRALCYAAPQIAVQETPWGDERDSVRAWSVNSLTKQWEPRWLYGGLLVENIVQAVSRDIMVDAMFRLEKGGYPVILTVHDEIITEPFVTQNITTEHFSALMIHTPAWAPGCPIACETWIGERYGK